MRLDRAIGNGLTRISSAAWSAFQAVNRRIPSKPFQPGWAPAPLLRGKERTRPPLGFPRGTDSLCPTCVKEVRTQILAGETDWRILVDGHPGEIKASIVERDGAVYMVKECPKHGRFEDLMSTDARFLERIERLYPGRDFRIPKDGLHEHGSSSIQWGRGAVLTVDLTNRCNMMCDPCFMDANQVGYVHELCFEDVKRILDDAVTIRPRRQLSVQFSGGEPTISPFFLDAVRYARDAGFFSIQAATNGIRFAQDPGFARAAAEAGMRLAYLQFDGVGNEANQHRKVENLFDVKLRAIQSLREAGIDVTLVVTIVNGINNHQVGPIIRFAVENIEGINAISFQPVSFTGRDEDISDEDRRRQRYTLTQLAYDVKDQLGRTEPLRDWFPLSATGPVSDIVDHLNGLQANWGSLKCGCHPNCGIGTLLLVNEATRQMVPVTEVLNVERVLEDFQSITDTPRPRSVIQLQVALSILRNYRASEAPPGLGPMDLIRVVDGHTGRHLRIADRARHEWRMLLVAGMWFQDLFNYDFRRTEMCIIPYGTQLGEISFCAYNTGVGFRQVVEKIFRTAATTEWFRTAGRHPVYAGGRSVPLPMIEDPRAPAVRMPGELPVLQEEPLRPSAMGGCGGR